MNKEQVYFKVKKLRKKFIENKQDIYNITLSRIIHYSFPVVYGGYVVDEGRKEYLAKYQQHYQVFRHCRHILSMGLENVMLTLTLNDVAIHFKEKYLKEVLRDYLNKLFIEWYAFADYGKENNRLHFHVIGCLPHDVIKRDVNGHIVLPVTWNYGFSYVSIVHNSKAVPYAYKAIDYASKCKGLKIRNRGISKSCIYSIARAMRSKESFIPWESVDYDF